MLQQNIRTYNFRRVWFVIRTSNQYLFDEHYGMIVPKLEI